MERVHEQFNAISKEVVNEFELADKQIFKASLRDEANFVILMKQKGEELMQEYNFIEQLRTCLKSKSEDPDQILNVLQTFIYKKDKQREQVKMEEDLRKQGITKLKIQRLTLKQLNLIHREFEFRAGKLRNFKALTVLLKQLAFFETFSPFEMNIILEKVNYLRVPAGTQIFRQDDLEDNMYVIVKGNVALETKQPKLGDLPLVFASVKDGERLGML